MWNLGSALAFMLLLLFTLIVFGTAYQISLGQKWIVVVLFQSRCLISVVKVSITGRSNTGVLGIVARLDSGRAVSAMGLIKHVIPKQLSTVRKVRTYTDINSEIA